MHGTNLVTNLSNLLMDYYSIEDQIDLVYVQMVACYLGDRLGYYAKHSSKLETEKHQRRQARSVCAKVRH